MHALPGVYGALRVSKQSPAPTAPWTEITSGLKYVYAATGRKKVHDDRLFCPPTLTSSTFFITFPVSSLSNSFSSSSRDFLTPVPSRLAFFDGVLSVALRSCNGLRCTAPAPNPETRE